MEYYLILLLILPVITGNNDTYQGNLQTLQRLRVTSSNDTFNVLRNNNTLNSLTVPNVISSSDVEVHVSEHVKHRIHQLIEDVNVTEVQPPMLVEYVQNVLPLTNNTDLDEDEERFLKFERSLDVYNIHKLYTQLRTMKDNMSEVCVKNLEHFFSGVEHSAPWAVRMLDSSGKQSAGFLFGHDYWLGSMTSCQDLTDERHYQEVPPFPVTFFTTKFYTAVNISASPSLRQIILGVCLPAECTVSDLSILISSTAPTAVQFVSMRPVPDIEYNMFLEPGILTLGLITAVITTMIVIGTVYDIRLKTEHRRALEYERGRRNKTLAVSKQESGNKLTLFVRGRDEVDGSRQEEEGKSIGSLHSIRSSSSDSSSECSVSKQGTMGQVLLCFSLLRNMKKICDTKTTDALSCVHGLRVFSLLWVIAGHTCMITLPFVDNRKFREVVERDFLFQSISNGAFSVDTFFFISGLLIAYVYNKSAKKGNGDEPAGEYAKSSLIKLAGGISYRILRLTAPYAVALVLTYSTAQWFQHNSVFDAPVPDHVNCAKYWWRNILYINTVFPVDEMCMIWSWYLADDTQFYVLGLVLLLLSTRYMKFATVSLFLLLVSSWFTTGFITIYTQHKPSIEEPLALFDHLYDKPWTRLGPYVVGMCAGYYLARKNCTASFNKVTVTLGWSASMLLTFVLVHALYGGLSQLASAVYVALSHTAWGLAIAWIVIACVTGHGGPVNTILSSPILFPLSRLSYCAYLVHPLIMLSASAHMDLAEHMQRDTMIITIFGYFVTSYLASAVLTLVFEAPIVSLLSIFHPLKRKFK